MVRGMEGAESMSRVKDWSKHDIWTFGFFAGVIFGMLFMGVVMWFGSHGDVRTLDDGTRVVTICGQGTSNDCAWYRIGEAVEIENVVVVVDEG